MDGEGIEMTWELASASTVSLADPALERIISRGPSSVDLDEQLKEIVDGMDHSQEVASNASCGHVTCEDEDEDDMTDYALFSFQSESEDEVECCMYLTTYYNSIHEYIYRLDMEEDVTVAKY